MAHASGLVYPHAAERRKHEKAMRRHQAEHTRLDERILAMYVDKPGGLVNAAFFERMSNQWRLPARD
jgi:hypothetical protein